MIDFILSKLDNILYFLIFIGIYIFLIYLWRKIANLETSVYRLDKAFTNMIIEKEKQKHEDQNINDNVIFNDDLEIIGDNTVIVEENTKNVDTNISNVDTNTLNINTEEIVDGVVKELLEEEKTYNKTQLLKMTVENLREIANKKNLSTDGNKTDLINRILG
jgi:hypothetical protein